MQVWGEDARMCSIRRVFRSLDYGTLRSYAPRAFATRWVRYRNAILGPYLRAPRDTFDRRPPGRRFRVATGGGPGGAG